MGGRGSSSRIKSGATKASTKAAAKKATAKTAEPVKKAEVTKKAEPVRDYTVRNEYDGTHYDFSSTQTYSNQFDKLIDKPKIGDRIYVWDDIKESDEGIYYEYNSFRGSEGYGGLKRGGGKNRWGAVYFDIGEDVDITATSADSIKRTAKRSSGFRYVREK